MDGAGVSLPGGVDIENHQLIDEAECVYEIIEQNLGPGIGVGLEHAEDTLVGHPVNRLQGRLNLGGMMGVIVDHHDAVRAPHDLEAPAHPPEERQRVLHELGLDA